MRIGWAALAALAIVAAPPAGVASEPIPALGRSFVVAKVSGTVLVKPPAGARFSLGREPRIIPVGSTVDAVRGKVRLVGAVKRSGGRQSGVFYAGAFRASQARRDRAVIDLKLVGGSFAGCGAEGSARASGRRRLGRRLWGVARGNFRTRGRHSSATVRGTKWLTADRCSSTAVESRGGRVEASNGSQSYVLANGDIFETLCTPAGAAPEDRQYCLGTLSREANSLYVFGFATVIHHGDYSLCVQPPAGDATCRVFPIPEPQPGATTAPVALAACAAESGPGTYTVSWTVPGQFLGALTFRVLRSYPPGTGLCPVSEAEILGMQPG